MLFSVSYCCDTQEVRDVPRVWPGNPGAHPIIRCLVCSEPFCSFNDEDIWRMAGILNAWEVHKLIICKVYVMKVTRYGQVGKGEKLYAGWNVAPFLLSSILSLLEEGKDALDMFSEDFKLGTVWNNS